MIKYIIKYLVIALPIIAEGLFWIFSHYNVTIPDKLLAFYQSGLVVICLNILVIIVSIIFDVLEHKENTKKEKELNDKIKDQDNRIKELEESLTWQVFE